MPNHKVLATISSMGSFQTLAPNQPRRRTETVQKLVAMKVTSYAHSLRFIFDTMPPLASSSFPSFHPQDVYSAALLEVPQFYTAHLQ